MSHGKSQTTFINPVAMNINTYFPHPAVVYLHVGTDNTIFFSQISI